MSPIACKRIEEVDAEIEAWAHLDRDHAMMQAEAADLHRQKGNALGPLHGVPLGIKDIFDTGDYRTEFGSPAWAGRTPRRDATAVARLREAGAVIMGKTVTTEYAYFQPGKTKNPHDPSRTPGGSSSGSAAAVAAHMVPGAIGSQTNGSVIRPAAFCGVVGFKPTHGLISRSGALELSRTLDHVGVFARNVEDAALLAEAARRLRRGRSGHASGRDARLLRPWPRASRHCRRDLRSCAPRSGSRPSRRRARPSANLIEALGEAAADVELGESFGSAPDMQRVVMEVEMAHNFRRDYEKFGNQLSDKLRGLIERGREYPAVEYMAALSAVARSSTMRSTACSTNTMPY